MELKPNWINKDEQKQLFVNSFQKKQILLELIYTLQKLTITSFAQIEQLWIQKNRSSINQQKILRNQKIIINMDMLDDSKEITPQEYESCYRYPIKLKQYPNWIGLSYEGTILLYQQKGLLCHYDKGGNLLSFIQIPKCSNITHSILFEEQINLIVSQKRYKFLSGNFQELGKKFQMIKWNFKANKMVRICSDVVDEEIHKDKQLLFQFTDNFYCIIMLQLETFHPQKNFIKKIKITYFKGAEGLQKDPYWTLHVNVQKDELFANYYLEQLKFVVIQNQLNPIIITNNITNGHRTYKLIVLNQDKQIFLHTLEIPAFQINDKKNDGANSYFSMPKQKQLRIQLLSHDFSFKYQWKINNSSVIYLSNWMNKREKKQYNYSHIIKNTDYLLKFKDSEQKSLKIKGTSCSMKKLIKQGDKNLYCSGFYCVRKPKSFSKFKTKLFINQNEIIISVTYYCEHYKILLADLLEKIIANCCEDLIYTVLQLLIFDVKIWRE